MPLKHGRVPRSLHGGDTFQRRSQKVCQTISTTIKQSYPINKHSSSPDVSSIEKTDFQVILKQTLENY